MASEALSALLRALTALATLGVPVAAFGGMAVNLWGRVRATMDADILVDSATTSVEAIVAAMRAEGFAHQDRIDRVRLDDGVVLHFRRALGDLGVSVKVDIVLPTSRLALQALRRRVELETEGRRIPVVTCEDLILLKLLAGRPIDRADAADLRERWKGQLDEAYLESAARDAGILEDFRSLGKYMQS